MTEIAVLLLTSALTATVPPIPTRRDGAQDVRLVSENAAEQGNHSQSEEASVDTESSQRAGLWDLLFGDTLGREISEALGKRFRELEERFEKQFAEEAHLSKGIELVDDFVYGSPLICTPAGFEPLIDLLKCERQTLEDAYSSYEVRLLSSFSLITYPDTQRLEAILRAFPEPGRPEGRPRAFDAVVEEISTEREIGPDGEDLGEIMLGARIAACLVDPSAGVISARGEWIYHVQGTPRQGGEQRNEVKRLAISAVLAPSKGWHLNEIRLLRY